MRKAILMLATALVTAGAPAFGQAGVTVTPDQPIQVWVNNRHVLFEDQEPIMESNRVLIPLRAVLKALPGMALAWDPVNLTVSGAYLDRTLRLQMHSRFADVNGRRVEMDVPAKTIGGRTMIPLRFLGEALGAMVTWSDPDRRVVVSVPVLNVPGSVATATSRDRRFYRNEEPRTLAVVEQARPTGRRNVQLSVGSQQTMSDPDLLGALERQVNQDLADWNANQASWSQAYSNFIMWGNFQVTFNTMTVFNGSAGVNGGPPSQLVPNNPAGWMQWQAVLDDFAARDQLLRQRALADYNDFVTVFRRVNPGQTPPPLP